MADGYVGVTEPQTPSKKIDNVVTTNGNGDTVYQQRVTLARTLTERMFARAPQTGYTLWLDTGDTSYVYIAEAPAGTAAGTASFQGIRVPLDASGNPVGGVATATAFAWSSRSGATWAT
jgi:hypothetical protein